MVRRYAGRAQEREILKVAGRLGHCSVDEIRHNDFGARLAWYPEAKYEWLAGVGAAIALLAPEFAHARIAKPSSDGIFSGHGDGCKVTIRKALFENRRGGLAMQIEAIGLTVELIPTQLEPFEPFVNRIERGLRVPFDVRVIDAQNDRTGVLARV